MLYSEEEFKIMLEKGYKCDLEAYYLLRDCSIKKELNPWNEWRKKNPKKPIYLQGADLSNFYMVKADFSSANCKGADFISANCQGADFYGANCQGGDFRFANCQGARFIGVNCQGAYFWVANCQGVFFNNAECQGAYFNNANCQEGVFIGAHCQKASFYLANCQEAMFIGAECQGANFMGANCQEVFFNNAECQGAYFNNANCQRADFTSSYMQGVKIQNAVLNYETKILNCEIDDETYFSNSNLNAVIIEPGIKAKLEQNIRRINWQLFCKQPLKNLKNIIFRKMPEKDPNREPYKGLVELFKDHNKNIVEPFKEHTEKIKPTLREAFNAFFQYPFSFLFYKLILLFWWISDYGYSTKRVFGCFFAFVFFFASIYYLFPQILAINTIPLPEKSNIFQQLLFNFWDISWRNEFIRLLQMFTFSLSSMVTLGFSNINVAIIKSEPNIWGLIVVSCNLMVGYFMLAVLVTRLAILFQSLAPGIIINKSNKKSTQNMSDNQGKPTKSVSDNQGKPTKSVSDNQGKPTKSVSDNQGKSTKSVSDNQGKSTKSVSDKQKNLYEL